MWGSVWCAWQETGTFLPAVVPPPIVAHDVHPNMELRHATLDETEFRAITDPCWHDDYDLAENEEGEVVGVVIGVVVGVVEGLVVE